MLLNDLIFDADMKFKTYSDLGSIRVGNKDCTVNISNGGYAGEITVLVFDLHSVPAKFKQELEHISVIDGLFKLYPRDTGSVISNHWWTLKGRYDVYRLKNEIESVVIFEKKEGNKNNEAD